MTRKAELARKHGYTLAGEAYALAAILFKKGNIRGAYQAMIQSLSCDDTIDLAVSLQEINQNALEEAGFIEEIDESEDMDEDEEEDEEVNEILSAFENIANFVEESSDEDDFEEDDDEDEDEEDEDEDEEDFEEDEDKDLDEDEEEDEESEFDEPFYEHEDDDDPMLEKVHSYSNNRNRQKREALARAIANKASLGAKPKK